MLNNKIHRLPVVDKGVLVGIVTLEDLHHMGPFDVAGFDVIHIIDMLTRLSVRQLMTENPKTINPSAYLIDSARLMLKHKISALPVVDGNELLGIITKSDIFRAFVEIEEEK